MKNTKKEDRHLKLGWLKCQFCNGGATYKARNNKFVCSARVCIAMDNRREYGKRDDTLTPRPDAREMFENCFTE